MRSGECIEIQWYNEVLIKSGDVYFETNEANKRVLEPWNDWHAVKASFWDLEKNYANIVSSHVRSTFLSRDM